MELNGKVALITGGGRGLGVAIAQRFVKEGARVCISGRNKENLEKTAKTMPKGSVAICPGDVSKDEDAKRMVEETVKFGGKIDILVNNAASDVKARVADLAPDDWRKVIGINLTGPFLTMHYAIPYMIKQGGGVIVNVASLGGLRCLPACPAYNTAKAGLIMLTQQAALDYGQYKIRINTLCPGGIDTELLDEMILPMAKALKTDKQGALDYFSHQVPLRRVSKPEEITKCCLFLASDQSSFMTGSSLLVDGGAAVVDISGAALSELKVQ